MAHVRVGAKVKVFGYCFLKFYFFFLSLKKFILLPNTNDRLAQWSYGDALPAQGTGPIPAIASSFCVWFF